MSKPRPPALRRLFLDIETSPNVGLFWRPGYKLTITHQSIVKERAIICIGYKWEGEKQVHCIPWDSKQDDKALLEKFLPIMNEADEIVAHNGDQFDIKWIRTRCIKHGILMAPDYVSIDTLQKARGKFNFNSNKLDYIAQFLGLGQKKSSGYDLWKKIVLDKDAKALNQMMAYCKQDVILLEKIYKKMDPYIPARSSVAINLNDCPSCGGKMKVSKRRVTASGYKKTQAQCTKCGKYHTMATSRFEKGKKI